MNFNKRANAPEINPYYTYYNPFYNSGNGLPNCTCYAYGRAYEVWEDKPNLSLGNAKTFWNYNIDNNIYNYGQEPKEYSIKVYNGTMTNEHGDTYGHVEFVESVNEDYHIVTGSSWSPDPSHCEYWYTDTYPNDNSDTHGHGEVLGYIYILEPMTKGGVDVVWSYEQARKVTNALYNGLLGREYTDGENYELIEGLKYDLTRIQAFDSVRDSMEYERRNVINDCYLVMRGTTPTSDEFHNWFDSDLTNNEIINAILYSDEFNEKYGV